MSLTLHPLARTMSCIREELWVEDASAYDYR